MKEETPRANRFHIGVFGRRNSGKSSLVNALSGQQAAIVSDVPGTTTDAVMKNIELPGIGAAVLVDTAGYDDAGELGRLRVERTAQAARRVDLALLVVAGKADDAAPERAWSARFKADDIPVVYIYNKVETDGGRFAGDWERELDAPFLRLSARTGEGVAGLLDAMAEVYRRTDEAGDLTAGLADGTGARISVLSAPLPLSLRWNRASGTRKEALWQNPPQRRRTTRKFATTESFAPRRMSRI